MLLSHETGRYGLTKPVVFRSELQLLVLSIQADITNE